MQQQATGGVLTLPLAVDAVLHGGISFGVAAPARDETINTIAERMLDERSATTLDEAHRWIELGLSQRGIRTR